MPDTATAKQKNRRIRKEALREQLQQQGHLQHVVDILNKLMDEENKLESAMVKRYKITLDTKLKLIGKYLPDLKAVEVEGEDGGPIRIELVRFSEDNAS